MDQVIKSFWKKAYWFDGEALDDEKVVDSKNVLLFFK